MTSSAAILEIEKPGGQPVLEQRLFGFPNNLSLYPPVR